MGLLKNFKIDSSSTNITTSFVQVDATGVSQEGGSVYCYNGGAQPLMLGVGPASGESNVCQVAPGVNQRIPTIFPKGRIAIKSLGSTQSSGVVVIDVYS